MRCHALASTAELQSGEVSHNYCNTTINTRSECIDSIYRLSNKSVNILSSRYPGVYRRNSEITPVNFTLFDSINYVNKHVMIDPIQRPS